MAIQFAYLANKKIQHNFTKGFTDGQIERAKRVNPSCALAALLFNMLTPAMTSNSHETLPSAAALLETKRWETRLERMLEAAGGKGTTVLQLVKHEWNTLERVDLTSCPNLPNYLMFYMVDPMVLEESAFKLLVVFELWVVAYNLFLMKAQLLMFDAYCDISAVSSSTPVSGLIAKAEKDAGLWVRSMLELGSLSSLKELSGSMSTKYWVQMKQLLQEAPEATSRSTLLQYYDTRKRIDQRYCFALGIDFPHAEEAKVPFLWFPYQFYLCHAFGTLHWIVNNRCTVFIEQNEKPTVCPTFELPSLDAMLKACNFTFPCEAPSAKINKSPIADVEAKLHEIRDMLSEFKDDGAGEGIERRYTLANVREFVRKTYSDWEQESKNKFDSAKEKLVQQWVRSFQCLLAAQIVQNPVIAKYMAALRDYRDNKDMIISELIRAMESYNPTRHSALTLETVAGHRAIDALMKVTTLEQHATELQARYFMSRVLRDVGMLSSRRSRADDQPDKSPIDDSDTRHVLMERLYEEISSAGSDISGNVLSTLKGVRAEVIEQIRAMHTSELEKVKRHVEKINQTLKETYDSLLQQYNDDATCITQMKLCTDMLLVSVLNTTTTETQPITREMLQGLWSEALQTTGKRVDNKQIMSTNVIPTGTLLEQLMLSIEPQLQFILEADRSVVTEDNIKYMWYLLQEGRVASESAVLTMSSILPSRPTKLSALLLMIIDVVLSIKLIAARNALINK